MTRQGLLKALAATCLFAGTSMVFGEPAFGYQCELLTEQDPNVVEDLKTKAETNERFVFAFRHSHKENGGLSDEGKIAANRARDHLADLWNTGDRIPTVFEMTYPPKDTRITETRERVVPDVKEKMRDIQDLENWLQNEKVGDLFPNGNRANTFVFVNSTAIDSLKCSKGKCDFACLEGVVIEFAIKQEELEKKKDERVGEIQTCYRLFPSEWMYLENADLPDWAKEPPGTKCAGRGSAR